MMKQKKSLVVAIAMLFVTCPASAKPKENAPTATDAERTVHCLLPARVQQLGRISYASRRQRVFETASRCVLRGGEYTVYDRSTPESSEAFYKDDAEAGDKDAQYNLGLVYESLFNPPRYREAARWYAEAAEQGHTDAMKNLAFLYEQGHGVARDQMKAVALLAEAGGITEDLVLRSELEAAQSEAEEEIRRLTAALETRNAETAALKADLQNTSDELERRRGELNRSRQELAKLEAQAEKDLAAADAGEIDALRARVSEQQRAISAREMAVADLEADVASYKAQLRASETKVRLQEKRLLAELDTVRRQSSASAAESTATINALNTRLDQVVRDLAGSRAENQTLARSLKASRSSLADAREDAREIQELLAEIQGRDELILEQTDRIESLNQRLATLQQSSATAAADAAAGRGEVERVSEELFQLRDAMQRQKVDYEQLLTSLEESRAALSSANERVAELDNLRGELSRRMATIEEQTAQIEALQVEVASALERNAELDDAVSERDYLRAELVSRESEVVRLQASIAGLESALVEETAARTRLSDDVAELEASLSGMRDQEEESGELRQMLARQHLALEAKSATIQSLTEELARVNEELATARSARTDQLALRGAPKPIYPKAPGFRMPAGDRFAIVIGNDDYQNHRDLSTAVNGARAVHELLTDRYGFESELLINVQRREIMDALNALRVRLSDRDYVLIYYAGHGDRDPRDSEVTYWLGTDARAGELALSADGINSVDVSMSVRAMDARHVMIIADSCYSGAMVRPPRVSTARAEIDRRQLEFYVKKRSRTVLASGGNSPVLDESTDGRHSVFTKALLEVLGENPDVMYGEALHAALVELVRFNADQLDFTQEPQYSEIADADHQNGQFVFKARRS